SASHPAIRQDTSHLLDNSIYVVVDDDRVELRRSCLLGGGGRQSAVDLLGIVDTSRHEPSSLLLARRRTHEDEYGIGMLAAHGERALHVEVEDDVGAHGEALLDRLPGRPVPRPEHREPLQEVVPLQAGVELLVGEEVVVDAVTLTGPRRARRHRYGEPQVSPVTLEEPADDGAFPRPGRSGNDQEDAQRAFSKCSSSPWRWCRPSPRTRRLSLISSSSMRRRALTFPTPGIDSSKVRTLSLASASSHAPRSSSSCNVRSPVFNCSFTAARMRRASAALSSAAWRCSGESGGGSDMKSSFSRRAPVRAQPGRGMKVASDDDASACPA